MEVVKPTIEFCPDAADDGDHSWSPCPSQSLGDVAPRLFRTFTAAQLDAGQFAVEYLVEKLLVRGQPAILAAPSKCLKTTLAIDLAISLASGEAFMGAIKVSGALPVVMMTGESGLGTVQETCRRICRSKEIELSTLSGLTVSDEVPHLFDRSHLAGVAGLLEQTQARVLICDPVYLMLDGSQAGNLFVMGQQLMGLASLCMERGVTLVMLHHTPKKRQSGGQYSPLTLADFSWSGFAEFARQWLLVNRRSAYAIGSGSHRLWLAAGGSAGHSGLWQIDVEEGPNSAAEGREYQISVRAGDRNDVHSADHEQSFRHAGRRTHESRKSAVLATLPDQESGGSGITRSEISRRTGLNAHNLDTVLGSLEAEGLLARGERLIGGRSRPVFWRAREPSSEIHPPARVNDSVDQVAVNQVASRPLESIRGQP